MFCNSNLKKALYDKSRRTIPVNKLCEKGLSIGGAALGGEGVAGPKYHLTYVLYCMLLIGGVLILVLQNAALIGDITRGSGSTYSLYSTVMYL